MSSGEGPKRPARKQVEEAITAREPQHAAGTVNIWTGRVLKEYRRPRDEPRKKEASQYRCHSKIDSGWTRGTASGASYCCLYFARGICHHGADCTYLHRLPTAADEERHRTDYSHDIFGRERNPASQDGRKKGVGSYERECKTLYVNYGGAGTLPTDELRKIIFDNFGEWGPIENVHLVPSKTLAFVRYEWRASAEFAKAAMHQQTLRGCDTTEVLDVRWANDDPNPRAVARVQHEREVALRDAYVKAVNELPPDAKRARIQQLHLAATVRPGMASAAYPDTDEQYAGEAAAPAGAGYRHTYEGWDSYAYQQQGQEPADEAAKWAAWQAWQSGGGGGGGGGRFSIDAMARGGDDYTRYLRPEDHEWMSQQQAQQQGAAQAATGVWNGQGAAWPAAVQAWDGQGGGAWAAAAGGYEQQQVQQEHEQQDQDEVAQEALGLLGGYGSSSDDEEEGNGGAKGSGEQNSPAAAAAGGTGEGS